MKCLFSPTSWKRGFDRRTHTTVTGRISSAQPNMANYPRPLRK